jgi:hypothetical protein
MRTAGGQSETFQKARKLNAPALAHIDSNMAPA